MPWWNIAIVVGGGRNTQVAKLGTRILDTPDACDMVKAIYQWSGYYIPSWAINEKSVKEPPECISPRGPIKWWKTWHR
jgi:hypothetical protein